MNPNQRINQLLLQTRGLSSTNLEGTALIERLRKEAFALAAWSCREIDRITAERDVLQEIVDEQRGQIATLVSRVAELTTEVASVTDERRHAVAALSEQVDAARDERDRARRLVCELQCDPPERFIGLPHEVAQMYGWSCFEVTP